MELPFARCGSYSQRANALAMAERAGGGSGAVIVRELFRWATHFCCDSFRLGRMDDRWLVVSGLDGCMGGWVIMSASGWKDRSYCLGWEWIDGWMTVVCMVSVRVYSRSSPDDGVDGSHCLALSGWMGGWGGLLRFAGCGDCCAFACQTLKGREEARALLVGRTRRRGDL